ncbi:unnamed protein product [Sphagnum troendelagicum]|uniref:Uncharacterized protein n=1 Tax=Sphagnum troendelagicum TaxID=128251 RepID=A0ABP0TRZ7_9BRYO
MGAIEVTKAQTKTEEPLLGSVSQMANKVAKMQLASQIGPLLLHLRIYIAVALLSLLHSLGFNPEEEEEEALKQFRIPIPDLKQNKDL